MYALEYGVIDLREYIGIGTRNQQRGTLLSRLKSRVSATPAPRGCHDQTWAAAKKELVSRARQQLVTDVGFRGLYERNSK